MRKLLEPSFPMQQPLHLIDVKPKGIIGFKSKTAVILCTF